MLVRSRIAFSWLAVLLLAAWPIASPAQAANPFYAVEDPRVLRELAPEVLNLRELESGMSFTLPNGEIQVFENISMTSNAGVRSIKGSSAGASLVLTTDGQRAFGYIARDGKYFIIDTVDGTPLIAESEGLPDPRLITKGWGDDFEIDPAVYDEILQRRSENGAEASALVPSVIKIAFFYDQALADAEGVQSPRTRAQSAVDFTNAAIAMHGVELTIELVYVGPLATPLGAGDPWSVFVSEPSKFDTAADYGADLLHYIYIYGGESYCGKGWLPGREAVSAASCGNFTMAHEIGHNIGLHHDRANASDYGYPWSGYYYGYICGNAGTIMAYYSPRVPHYSSPLLQNGGEDCGVAIGEPDAAFNGEVLEVRREATADYVPDQVTVGTVTITTVGPVQVDEAGAPSVYVDVFRDGDLSQATSVEIGAIEVDALAGYDYVDFVQRLEFAPGEAAKQVVIDIIDDGTYEPTNETFEVVLRYPYLLDVVPNPLTVTIVSDDPDRGIAEFSSPYWAIWEGHGTLQVPVRRVGSTDNTLSVNFNTATVTAIPGVDYEETSGTVDFAVGQTDAFINIPIIDDNDFEGYIAVHFRVFLTGDNVNLAQPPFDVYVWNDDLLYGEGRFTADTYYILENLPTVYIGIDRINGADANWDYCALFDSNGTATPNVDYLYYNSVCQVLTDGVTSAGIAIDIYDDADAEGEEYFEATLTSSRAVTNPSTTRVVIIDDDGPNAGGGSVGLLQDSYVVDEFGGTVSVVVRREGGSSLTALANYQTTDGTAMSNGDFIGVGGTLIWEDGDTADKTIDVIINNDSLVETDETFTFELTTVAGATSGAITSAGFTIVSEDNNGVVGFSQATGTVDENGYVDFDVTRTGGSTGFVAVQYATQALTAGYGTDYIPVSGSLSWVDGEMGAKTIRIEGIDDDELEGSETLRLFLHAPGGGVGLGIDEVIVTILDDEAAPPASDILSLADINGNSAAEVAMMLTGTSNHLLVLDGATGAQLADISFGADPVIAVDVIDDISGNGAPEIVVLGIRPSGQVRVQVNDSLTGASVNTVFFGDQYAAVDMAIVPDTNSNNAPEIAVLGQNASGGLRVQARDSLTDAETSTTFFGANSDPVDLQVLPDMNANTYPEMVVHSRITASGQTKTQIRDSETAQMIRQVFFGSAYDPMHTLLVNDVSGDGMPDLAQLGQTSGSGAVRLQIKPSSGGPVISNAFLGTADVPIETIAVGDVNASGWPDTATLVQRPDGTGKVILRDGETGDFIQNIFFGAIDNPVGLTLVEDLDASGAPELAALGERDGVRRVQIRDSVSGANVNTIDFP